VYADHRKWPVLLIADIDSPAPGGDCLTIVAESVTIDLGNFRIRGRVFIGSGIIGTDQFSQNIVVRNGIITNFENRIFLGRGTTVEGVQAIRNATGIQATGIVRGNMALDNVRDGIVADNGIVSGNIADGNGINGIRAF
jgi:hypothetical protein